MTKHNVDKKPIIVFDMDGVILYNSNSKIRIAKKLGFDIKIHHTPSDIIRKILPQTILEELQSILYDNHKVALATPLMRGIRTVLDELNRKKISFFLISRRKIPEVAIMILKKHRLWPKYFNEGNARFVIEPKDKDEKAKEFGLTHYIDDELKVINALASVPNKFLFDQFGIFEEADHYTKIRSWSEFKKHLFQ